MSALARVLFALFGVALTILGVALVIVGLSQPNPHDFWGALTLSARLVGGTAAAFCGVATVTIATDIEAGR